MVWINEFHYDNDGADIGEFVEIAGAAGTDLTGYSIVLYNGSSGASYQTIPLSGLIANQQNGFGTVSVAAPGIQNGAPDGVALVGPGNVVISFISYEGSFVATNGPAVGMTSTDVGFIEPGNAPGTSIGLVGNGDEASDFTWQVITDDTPGGVNAGQTFGSAPVAPTVSIGDASVVEGDSGTTILEFTVTRTGGTGAFTVDYTVAGDSASEGDDFTATDATLSFAEGEATRTIQVVVSGDTAVEANETLTVTLANATAGAQIGDGVATGTIENDDASPVTGTPWINEFHYDNAGTDIGEFIEIAGVAGLDLTGYSLVLYNGSNGQVYHTAPLSGVIADDQNGFGTVSFGYPENGIQNGAPDAVALVAPDNSVVEFISYEGPLTATNGPASGLTATDVGVLESGSAVGTSIARVGQGDSGDDFTWVLANDDTPDAVNTGQTLGVSTATRVSIDDVVVTEGDAGTRTATFTVTRSDNTGDLSVDYATADGTATAGSDYVAAGGTLGFTAGGALTQTVSVTINGDTAFETNETFTVNLSNLVSTSSAELTDAQGLGTIAEDDVALIAIYDIQGAGHRSAYAGQQVTTRGIVTALDKDGNGYWIQDAAGDGNVATSDAIFIFNAGGIPASVVVGAEVQVGGTVSEFRSTSRANDLTLTELTNTSVVVLSTGNALPRAVTVGALDDAATLHRTPPTVDLGDDDINGAYDPVNDGIDFYESLEGMRVTFEDVRVTSPQRSNFGEIWGTPHIDGNASNNDRGGLTISDTTPSASIADKLFDFNPERIMIDDEAGIATPANLNVGDRLGDVTGVMTYEFGTYRLNATEAYTRTDGGLQKEVTTIEENLDRIRVASFNVENLSPVGTTFSAGEVSTQAKFDALAQAIVVNLGTPEIIALQELQDNNGILNNGVVDAATTITQLLDAIVAAGGPRYSAIVANPVDGADGGVGGGNIRNAYLYLPEYVKPTADNGLLGNPGDEIRLLPTSKLIGADPDGAGPLTADPDFSATRKSLPIEWNVVGIESESFWTINNHLSSKGGSAPLQGSLLDLPLYAEPLDGAAVKREGQAIDVNAFIDQILANGDATDDQVIALGDFNEFQFFPAVQLVTGALERLTTGSNGVPSTFAEGSAVMKALGELLPESERYSYVFEGNAQTLDQVLVSLNLVKDALFDIIHMNAEFSDQLSDHDPSVVSLLFERSAGLATDGADVLDEAAFVAHFGATRGSLDGDDTIDGLGGNDLIRAGGGNDRVLGGSGNDMLFGDGGSDWIVGGQGDDVLNGGAGADIFVFHQADGAGSDRIVGFSAEDLFLTDARIADSNDDGIIVFGGDRRVDLGGGALVAITGTNNKAVVKLYYEGIHHDDASGLDYFAYSLTGHHAPVLV